MALTPGIRIAARFEITGPLGAGSMGEVYQAHDLKLHRDVAVKLLSPALATSEEHLLRFEREARAASALNHPNICTIYDVGQAEEADNRPYLVMELLKGQTLFEALAAGPLPLGTAVNLGVQVADALDVAHNAGIVHRDIKPANIFITSRGDAKLLDFGLAAVLEVTEAGVSPGRPDQRRPASLTNPGVAIGTVLYMSPEQALGDPLDARTDIFSLGLVLYEMATGQRAFDGRSTTAIVDAILHAMPTGLGSGDASTIPRDLRRLLARMLEKDKAQRPESAAEVAALLRAVQSGSIAGREYAAARTESASGSLTVGSEVFRNVPDFTPSTSRSSGLRRAFDDQKWTGIISMGMAVFMLAVAGYAGLTWYRSPAPPLASREPLLIADFANTTGETVFDGALRDALEVQLQQSPYLNVVSPSQVRSSLQLMERPADERITAAVAHDLCQRLGVKAILLGSIAPLGGPYVIGLEAQACRTGDVIGREQVQAASKAEVLASVGAAAARLRETLGESIGSIQRFNVPVQNATTASLDALKAYSLGMETRAKIGDVQAIPFFERALELDPNFALAAARLGAIYTNLRELEQAQLYMKRAFTRNEVVSQPERLFITSHYHFLVTGRLDEAVAAYRLWIDTYPQDWIPHNNLSATYVHLSQFDDALQEGRAAIALGPNQVVAYQQLARTLLAVDRFDECQALLGEAVGKGLDSSAIRSIAFSLAFLSNDTGAMQEHLRAVAPRADRYLVQTEAARAAVASGDIASGRTLYAQAATSARAARLRDFAATLVAEEALADALLGDRSRAQAGVQRALATSNGIETTWVATLAAAFSGRAALAAQLAARYERTAPPAPDVVAALAPMTQAAVALASQNGKSALAALAPGADSYERTAGPWLPYLRGLAYEALGDPRNAAIQFGRAVARHGTQATNLVRTLGHLRLARTLRASGDVAGARQAYGNFAAAWRNSDPNHPLLVEARREVAALGSAASPPSRPQ